MILIVQSEKEEKPYMLIDIIYTLTMGEDPKII